MSFYEEDDHRDAHTDDNVYERFYEPWLVDHDEDEDEDAPRPPKAPSWDDDIPF